MTEPPASSPRSRLPLDERRAQLLELGLQLFSTRLYDDVAIEDIAREAGISRGLLYHYFGGKREFYVAVVQHAADHLLEATNPDPRLDPVTRVLVGLDAYLRFVEERVDAFTALVYGNSGDEQVAAIVSHVRDSLVERMLTALGLTEPRPAFRLAARAWIGGVEVACLDWLARRDLPREDLILLLAHTLAGHLVVAARLDPDAELKLPLDPALLFPPRRGSRAE